MDTTQSANATIRHEIDPALVAGSVEKAIAENEHQRILLRTNAETALARYHAADEAERPWHTRVPEGAGYVDPMIDEWNARQRDYYARVRIIERLGEKKPFVLVYGDQPDDASGLFSGGFATIDDARKWFLGQGR